MDYYTVGEDCLLIEEFAWHADWTAAGLRSACWTGRWWGSAAFSREVRADPVARERVRAVGRSEAELVFRRLGGASLPAEAELRTGYQEYQPFPETTPLRLTSSEPLRGYREMRVYRVLFAPGQGGELRGERTFGEDRFSWILRAVGGVAYGLDVTVHLRQPSDANVAPVLGELTEQVRMRGLIPVTVERFA
jgi:hypothetical protein